MRKVHVFGIVFSSIIIALLTWIMYMLHNHPANILYTTFRKLENNQSDMSDYYTSDYIKITKIEYGRKLKNWFPSDTDLISFVHHLDEDVLFFNSLSMIISNSIGFPNVHKKSNNIIKADFRIQAPVNFELSLYCLQTEKGLMFDSISDISQLLDAYPEEIKNIANYKSGRK